MRTELPQFRPADAVPSHLKIEARHRKQLLRQPQAKTLGYGNLCLKLRNEVVYWFRFGGFHVLAPPKVVELSTFSHFVTTPF
ncbi:MAG: hypothetical protein ACLPKB_08450 [Xanthobacteraceae bacterium]